MMSHASAPGEENRHRAGEQRPRSGGFLKTTSLRRSLSAKRSLSARSGPHNFSDFDKLQNLVSEMGEATGYDAIRDRLEVAGSTSDENGGDVNRRTDNWEKLVEDTNPNASFYAAQLAKKTGLDKDYFVGWVGPRKEWLLIDRIGMDGHEHELAKKHHGLLNSKSKHTDDEDKAGQHDSKSMRTYHSMRDLCLTEKRLFMTMAHDDNKLVGCGIIDCIPVIEICHPTLRHQIRRFSSSSLGARFALRNLRTSENLRLFLRLSVPPSRFKEPEFLARFQTAVASALGVARDDVNVLLVRPSASLDTDENCSPAVTFVDFEVFSISQSTTFQTPFRTRRKSFMNKLQSTKDLLKHESDSSQGHNSDIPSERVQAKLLETGLVDSEITGEWHESDIDEGLGTLQIEKMCIASSTSSIRCQLTLSGRNVEAIKSQVADCW